MQPQSTKFRPTLRIDVFGSPSHGFERPRKCAEILTDGTRGSICYDKHCSSEVLDLLRAIFTNDLYEPRPPLEHAESKGKLHALVRRPAWSREAFEHAVDCHLKLFGFEGLLIELTTPPLS
jgi:hypothetical protein